MRRFFLILSLTCLAGPLIFASSLRGQEEPIRILKREVKPEPINLEAFSLGWRIRVTLKNGAFFQGLLAEKSAQKIKLDLSGEKDGLNGRLGLYLDQIASIRRLPQLSPVEEEAAKIARQKELEKMRERMTQRKAIEAERKDRIKKAREEALAKATQEKRTSEEQALLRLLEKFPPEEGWGADRIDRIHDNILLYDVFPSPEEEEFMQKFPLWLEALKVLERRAAEEEEKAKEAQRPPEAPAPEEIQQPVAIEEAPEAQETEEAEETEEVEETEAAGELEEIEVAPE
ncbi:MAG: hypothetical protein AMS15_08710 [Planctomycetes bacterium DG_23]|nr:MAG: hypothetical protein AMS15_08710 [Planctomycetes bacterium DG_23]